MYFKLEDTLLKGSPEVQMVIWLNGRSRFSKFLMEFKDMWIILSGVKSVGINRIDFPNKCPSTS